MTRALSYVCTIVGVVGFVACLLLIPGIWVGRSVALQWVTELTSAVSVPLQQVENGSAEFQDRITALQQGLNQVAGEAGGAAARASVESQLADRLLDTLDQTINPAYVRVREAYVALRERLASATQAANRLQRLVPGSNLPTLPLEDFANIDRQLQDMDATLRGLRAELQAGRLPDAVPQVDTLRRVDAGMREVGTGLESLKTRVNDIAVRAQQVEVRIAEVQASIDRGLTLAAAVLTLLCAVRRGAARRAVPVWPRYAPLGQYTDGDANTGCRRSVSARGAFVDSSWWRERRGDVRFL